MAVASGSGKCRGATSRKSANPMVFMARAAAPMLPGWLGWERTMQGDKVKGKR